MELQILKYNIFIIKARRTFSYSYDGDKLEAGTIVEVDFRNKKYLGIVISMSDYTDETKNISNVTKYIIPSTYIDFCKFIANYNLAKVENFYNMLLPFDRKTFFASSRRKICGDHDKEDHNPGINNIKLNNEQQDAMNKIIEYSNCFNAILLHGITGSGKTEVFLKAVNQIMSTGRRQILILVPEIALSVSIETKISKYFGANVYSWHTGVTAPQKRAIWEKAIAGDPMIIVGARSALFIPFASLACIIIDEEHDKSYKQSDTPLYNARDMAVYLAKLRDIPIVLISATPSVESYNNVISGKYKYIKLTSRFFSDAKLPEIIIDNMHLANKIYDNFLTDFSLKKIKECIREKRQALIFVNRRGYAPKLICRDCDHKFECNICSTWLCYHMKRNILMCHHCGNFRKFKETCPNCSGKNLSFIGVGIEQAQSILKKLLPDSRIEELSSDTIDSQDKIQKTIDKINNMEVDIILGTQIIIKGQNFHNIQLVVVSSMDGMLHSNDFRAIERSYQTFHQVAGRAGRKESGAQVILQTYDEQSNIIKTIANGDIEKLYDMEIRNRRILQMPPFGKIISILISSTNLIAANHCASEIVKRAPGDPNVKIVGPIEASILKIRNRYRIRIMVNSAINYNLNRYVTSLLSGLKQPKNTRIIVDVNPYDFY